MISRALGNDVHYGPVHFGDCEVAGAGDQGAARSSTKEKFDAQWRQDVSKDKSSMCLRGDLGVEGQYASGGARESSWLEYGHGEGGLYLRPWLSLQGRGLTRRYLPVRSDNTYGSAAYVDRRTEYAVVQLGNPVLDHWRLTAGKTRIPFGADLSAAPESYQAVQPRLYWDAPSHGVYGTFDDLRSLRFDLGYGSTLVDQKPIAATDALSARLLTDISALEGTRIALSGYAQRAGIRRFGLALINKNHRDDFGQFEFVRSLAAPDGGEVPFEQLLRASYTSAWRANARWVVEIDDERLRARRGIVTYESLWHQHLIMRAAVGYFKSESGDDRRQWTLTLGTEARL